MVSGQAGGPGEDVVSRVVWGQLSAPDSVTVHHQRSAAKTALATVRLSPHVPMSHPAKVGREQVNYASMYCIQVCN